MTSNLQHNSKKARAPLCDFSQKYSKSKKCQNEPKYPRVRVENGSVGIRLFENQRTGSLAAPSTAAPKSPKSKKCQNEPNCPHVRVGTHSEFIGLFVSRRGRHTAIATRNCAYAVSLEVIPD